MTVSIRQVMDNYLTLSPVWGLQDVSLIRGNSAWPTEDTLRQNLG